MIVQYINLPYHTPVILQNLQWFDEINDSGYFSPANRLDLQNLYSFDLSDNRGNGLKYLNPALRGDLSSLFFNQHPDVSKTFQQIVEDNGFISEVHPINTLDGYKLNVYRIRAHSTRDNAPVVFLQHGILDTANCWIMHYAHLAPAFQLVLEGYDVWLGNQRGTTFSTGHVTLDTNSKQYWEFSFTEMGEYDAPAQVEYALNFVGQRKAAAFIGHSQGSSQMFYALSAHPDFWKKKVNLFVALAPVTSLHNTPSEFLRSASDFQV